MTDAIRPALTPEEWEERHCDDPPRMSGDFEDDEGRFFVDSDGDLRVTYDSAVIDQTIPRDEVVRGLALANHALPDGHPNKLTREDVLVLLEEGRDLTGYALDADTPEERARQRANGEALLSLAARIEALLPPE